MWWGEFVCLISPVVCRQSAAVRRPTDCLQWLCYDQHQHQPSHTHCSLSLARQAARQHSAGEASLHCGLVLCVRGCGRLQCVACAAMLVCGCRVGQLTLSVLVSGDFHPVRVVIVQYRMWCTEKCRRRQTNSDSRSRSLRGSAEESR